MSDGIIYDEVISRETAMAITGIDNLPENCVCKMITDAFSTTISIQNPADGSIEEYPLEDNSLRLDDVPAVESSCKEVLGEPLAFAMGKVLGKAVLGILSFCLVGAAFALLVLSLI